MPVPKIRIRSANDRPIRADGAHVLYWMTAFRRTTSNFALDRAIEHARELGKPLLILEALRCGYEWASDRIHRFALDGMADNAEACRDTPVRHHAYVERRQGDGSGLLARLAQDACVVVGDDYPCFFLPRMAAAAAERLEVAFELVDGNGLLPMRAPGDRVFSRAVDLRRFLQKNLPDHLGEQPRANPLARLRLPAMRSLPRGVASRWPSSDARSLRGDSLLGQVAIDHGVPPVAGCAGGAAAGRRLVREFVHERLDRYDEDRNHPDADGGSGLSPYLHFGHVGTHQVWRELVKREDWTPDRLGAEARGKREGFWGMTAPAEAFLDELVTWRELGFNMCSRRDDYDRYESLPDWAQKTLAEHLADPREHVYDLDAFDRAETHDEIWNAAQRQLRAEGRIHNYLRMLWGKKIFEWSESPVDALDVMIELNNRHALDGRDPNSYSGIFWVLGRYDRAWGPERPIYGKIRYMTSESTRRKLRLKDYLERFGD